MSIQQSVQDTINFQLRADTVVVNDTVKITVGINALVTSNSTESSLRRDIKEALNRFIPVDWQFNGLERSSDSSGFERVSLRATARVPETENYNLENRAKEVSRQGLSLNSVSIDNTVPAHQLENAEKELRIQILKKAGEELAEINKVTGRDYRLSSVRYSNQGDPIMRKSAMVTVSATYGSGFAPGGGDEESLSNAQKVSLAADIVFSVTAI